MEMALAMISTGVFILTCGYFGGAAVDVYEAWRR